MQFNFLRISITWMLKSFPIFWTNLFISHTIHIMESIYLQKPWKSTLNVGKYTIYPWMVWVSQGFFMSFPRFFHRQICWSDPPRHKLIGGLGGEKARWGQNVQARSTGKGPVAGGCLVDAGGSVVGKFHSWGFTTFVWYVIVFVDWQRVCV